MIYLIHMHIYSTGTFEDRAFFHGLSLFSIPTLMCALTFPEVTTCQEPIFHLHKSQKKRPQYHPPHGYHPPWRPHIRQLESASLCRTATPSCVNRPLLFSDTHILTKKLKASLQCQQNEVDAVIFSTLIESQSAFVIYHF